MSDNIRVSPVEPGTKSELADLEALIQKERFGEIPILYKVLLNSPSVTSGWEQLLTAIRKKTGISPALREMVILRVAVLNRAQFEYDAHRPHAEKAGVSEAKIDAIGQVPLPEGVLDETETLVIELTDRMTRDVEVPASVMDRVNATYQDKEVVELVATVAAYNMVSRFLVALNITH